MYCRKCGAGNPEQAQQCENCGEPLLPIATESEQSCCQPNSVPNYFVWSILSTVLCCQILGIVAIVYSAHVNNKLAAGDIEGATRASRNARNWSWAAFGTGLAYYLIAGGMALLSYLTDSSGH